MNCAAIPETLFESEFFGYRKGAFTGADRDRPGIFALAAGGTLLLDEVGELEPPRQAKLLLALDDGEITPVGAATPEAVDVRVVAATSRDLHDAVRSGAFRADLYYRLALLALELPPLRDRGDDAALLASHFLKRHGRRHGIKEPGLAPDARQLVLDHPWPGNIRELAYVMEAALILAPSARVERSTLEAVLSRLPGSRP